MSRVSRRMLSKEVQYNIDELFWNSLASCKNKETVATFLEDVLTPTEKIMLTKRVAIAFLLLKGYDYQKINQTLKVSSGTIWQVKIWLETKGKGYRTVLTKLLQQQEMKVFILDLDEKIQKLFFPTPGKGVNWSEAQRLKWEAKRKRKNEL